MSQVSIETILCLPHNQYRFKYKINDGGFHFVEKHISFEFFARYLKTKIKSLKLLNELLSSFQPFIIIPSEKEILPLSKAQVEDIAIKRPLENLSEKDLNKIKQSMNNLEYSDHIPNDSLMKKIASSILE